MIPIIKTNSLKIFLFTVIISISLISSCDKSENIKSPAANQTDMSVLEKEIESRLREFEKHLKNGDSLALGEMYLESAEIIPSTVGRANIIKVFSSMIKDSITGSSFKTVGLWGNDQLLVEEGTGEWSHENGQVVGRGRYLLVWQKDNGEWRILRDTWFPDEED